MHENESVGVSESVPGYLAIGMTTAAPSGSRLFQM